MAFQLDWLAKSQLQEERFSPFKVLHHKVLITEIEVWDSLNRSGGICTHQDMFTKIGLKLGRFNRIGWIYICYVMSLCSQQSET